MPGQAGELSTAWSMQFSSDVPLLRPKAPKNVKPCPPPYPKQLHVPRGQGGGITHTRGTWDGREQTPTHRAGQSWTMTVADLGHPSPAPSGVPGPHCSCFPVPQPSLSLLPGDHGAVKGEQLLLCHSHNTPGTVQPYSLPLLALGTGKK